MTETDSNAVNFGASYSNPYDDPLYLSNSDFHGVQLLSTIFNGCNYLSWSRRMTLALTSKNKQGFLDGTTAMPDKTSFKLQQWRRSDTMVRCWILNSMLDVLKEGFMTVKTAKQLWSEIRERYGQSNGPLLFSIKKGVKECCSREYVNCEYFNKLKKYWDDIEEIESYPDFSCGALTKCSCNLLKKIMEQALKEKVIMFLMGLNNSFDNVRSNILSMEPLPNINKTYSIVHQIESQKMINSVINVPHDASAFMVDKKYTGNQWRKDLKRPKMDERWCDYCKKVGHVREKCFRLHPELKARFDNFRAVNHRSSVHLAENKEVPATEHPLEMSTSPVNAGVHEKTPSVNPALMFHSNPDGMAFAHMSCAGKTLESFAFCAKIYGSSLDWIIDSGATAHMTSQRHQFIRLRKLSKPVIVGLLDGSTQLVTESGDIQIHSKITLYDVLYVPSFKHNLLSVSKLLTENDMYINFHTEKCVLQDPAKDAVAIGSRQAGLYKLIVETREDSCSNTKRKTRCSASTVLPYTAACSSNKEMLDLMHARLGHTLLSKMQHVQQFSCGGLQSYFCDTCIMAKMHKLPFERSNSKANSMFDFVTPPFRIIGS
ncbi:hypothetical protein RND81_04G063500 [Saponaria officinalis]|uniref:Retrotransposon Copia-like N-terminal domain-containing protein n=1 Tax=Saponaria officinalis TaxID=3572 RepID=A0AAW1LK20_SAPOF